MKQGSIKSIYIRLESLNEKILYNKKNLELATKLLKQISKKDDNNTNKK